MTDNATTFIDLFCGMGGFRIAFESQGCKCVYSSDIDEYVCRTYELNFGIFPKSDITKVSSTDIPDFDILCAGFPCQPFSVAGKRLGFADTRGTLFFDVARILNDKKPTAFILENVKGIVNHDGGKTLSVILETLDELGYDVEWRVLNSKDYGVPQNRERWYCIGIKKELGIKFSLFPNKKPLEYKLSNIIQLCDVDGSYKSSSICLRNIQKHIDAKQINVTDSTLAYEIRPSRCQFAVNDISPCLTAKMGTGGNNVPVVIMQKRRLTERECLRIMGYPDTYKVFTGHHTYKQIGNSVVVPIITELAKKLVQTLQGVKK